MLVRSLVWFRTAYVQSSRLTTDAPPSGTLANIRIYLIFLETRIIGIHFAADIMGLSSFKFFSVGLRKTFVSARVRLGR